MFVNTVLGLRVDVQCLLILKPCSSPLLRLFRFHGLPGRFGENGVIIQFLIDITSQCPIQVLEAPKYVRQSRKVLFQRFLLRKNGEKILDYYIFLILFRVSFPQILSSTQGLIFKRQRYIASVANWQKPLKRLAIKSQINLKTLVLSSFTIFPRQENWTVLL